jgi:hypothetical protein
MTIDQLKAILRECMESVDIDITPSLYTNGVSDEMDRPPTGDDYNRLWDAVKDALEATDETVDPLPKIPSSIEDYDRAAMAKADRWVPACGGMEVPFSYNNRVYLYVYNPAQHKHGWLDMGTDMLQFDNPTENS